MIIGIGNDLCNIERIQRSLDRFGEKFERRVFTPYEIAKARGRRRVAETYAKRFAAKEACAKALGTGVPRAGVHWQHLASSTCPPASRASSSPAAPRRASPAHAAGP
jgi:holo-[acyl-carrier protein] synthase